MDLATLGTTVAILASVFGAFVAVDQLTATARQRRFATFLRSAAEAEEAGSPQAKVLHSLRRDTMARLVGSSAVPLWSMASDVWVVAIAAGLAFVQGQKAPTSPVTHDIGGWWAAIWPLLALFLMGWQAARRVIRQVDERRRIADDYLAGAIPLAPKVDLVTLMEGGSPGYEWRQGGVLTAALMAVAFGVAWGVADPKSIWGTMTVVAGAVLMGGVVGQLRMYLARRRGAIWKHPISFGARPPKAAEKRAAAAEEEAVEAPSEHPSPAI